MKKVLFVITLLAIAGSSFAIVDGGLVDANTYLGVITDKFGDDIYDTGPTALPDSFDAAFVYTCFELAPLRIEVTTDDCWYVQAIAPSDFLSMVAGTPPFGIENVGGISADLSLFVSLEDVNPDVCTPWDLVGSGLAAGVDEYELGAVITADPCAVAPTVAGLDFTDLNASATGDWYVASAGANNYSPTAASEYSEVTAANNLNLWPGDDGGTGADEDNVLLWLTFVMGDGGSSTATGVFGAWICRHGTQIAIESRVCAG